jgi:hypothetical protein
MFEHFLLKILNNNGVAVRRYFCGIAPSLRSARRSDWRNDVFGEENVAPVRLFFRAGVCGIKAG